MKKIDAESPDTFRQRADMVKGHMEREVDIDYPGMAVHFNEAWNEAGTAVTIEARVYNTMDGDDETTGQK